MLSQVSGYTAAAVARAGGSIDLQQPAQAAAAAAGEGQPEQQLGQLSAKDGVSAIHSFVSYLLSMTNQDSDGRIIIEAAASTSAPAAVPSGRGGSSASEQPQQRGGRLRYVVLNAARHFGSLLACARAVLLVSGTLAPVDGLTAQLFPDVAPSRIHHFECGHVVPADQLLAVSVGRGPSGRGLNLKHEGRGEVATIEELGQLLVGLAGVVPQGLVVFVPSFGYLEQLAAQWTRSGLWARLAARKQVFRCGQRPVVGGDRLTCLRLCLLRADS
jgi:chromosome transmission fidelity protein 1